MFGGSRLLQGLVFGVVGCAMVSLTKSSIFAGGGVKSAETHSQVPLETKLTVPKEDKFIKLLLAGTDAENGLVIELSQNESEERQWKLNKATWRGQDWGRNWTLYSDGFGGEYTFTDRVPYEHHRGCWGYARYWKGNKVCVAYGRVKQGEEEKWKNNFPKIKFEGWVTRLKSYGYGTGRTLDTMEDCSISISENKKGEQDIDLTVTISCKDGTMTKTLNSADFEKIVI